MFNFDDAIAGQTWVARALDVAPRPPLESPWPPYLQSGLDPDYSVYLPEAIGGEIAAAEAFVAASEALAAIDAPAPEPPPPPTRVVQACTHTSYRVNITAAEPNPIFSASRQRGYVLIVNTGPNDVFIAYGTDADATGLLLASGGVGFHELINGTSSSLSVFSTVAGSFVHIVDGSHDPVVP